LGYILSTARKDLLRRWKDPIALGLWIGIPLVIGTLMTLVSSGSDGKPPQAHVLVVDDDDSFVSGMLLQAFQMGGGSDGLFRTEVVEREAGQDRIHQGDASALLVIPAGFGEAVLAEEPTELLLVKNPAQRILPGLAEQFLSIISDGAFYLHRVLGDEIRAIAIGPEEGETTLRDASVASMSISINQAMRRFEKYLFPPVIELEVREPVSEPASEEGQATAKVDTPMGMIFLPGVLIMALFFVAQGLSEDLWQERQQGTLRRAACAPHPVAAFLLGKCLAATAIIALIDGVALAAGWLAFGFPARLLIPALAWATATGVALWAAMATIQLLASSRRAGSVLTSAVLFPLLMLGGSFFPFEAMPAWMVRIGGMTPNGWALNHLRQILLEQQVSPASWLALLSLGAGSALLFTIAALRLQAVVTRP
jgi:ABC-type Na+ efflux pump permease subunit